MGVKAKRAPADPVPVSDLLARLGGVPPERVMLTPHPGTATVRDVVRMRDRHKRLFELVDRTLVEKAMGANESSVAVEVAFHLKTWSLQQGDVGVVLGVDGMLKFLRSQVRMPDASFLFRSRLPGGRLPGEAVPELAPDLCVEVLSEGNTAREMERKLREYFRSGVRVVWVVDDRTRTVRAHTSPGDATAFGPDDTLTGGDVLPGFAVPVARLFEGLPPPAPPKPARKRK